VNGCYWHLPVGNALYSSLLGCCFTPPKAAYRGVPNAAEPAIGLRA